MFGPAFFNGCQTPLTTSSTWNIWIESYNAELQTMVDTKGKSNLFTVDLYSALSACWGVSCNADGAHPNNEGYEIIAEELYNKMVEEGLN